MLPVTLLTGLDDGFRGDVAGNLLAAAGPAGVMVEYDVSGLTTGPSYGSPGPPPA